MSAEPALHAELRAATRAYLSRDEPTTVAPAGRRGWTPESWRRIATDLGLAGVCVATEHGGLGLTPDVEAVVHEELGRVLHEGPYLSTVGVALPAFQQLGRDDLVAAIGAGETTYGTPAGVDPPWTRLTSTNGRVGGILANVRDATASGGVLAPVDIDGQAAIVLARPSEITAVDTVDLTRPLYRVAVDGVEVLATGDDARAVAATCSARAGLALCAESVGVAARALELTVDYLKVRHQFGRAIGSFQAVQHQCADLLVVLELARSAVDLALNPSAAPAADLAIARLQCGRSVWQITEAALHLHGGIGFTWEHRMHLYFRRAKTNQLLLSDGRAQHDVIVDALVDALVRVPDGLTTAPAGLSDRGTGELASR